MLTYELESTQLVISSDLSKLMILKVTDSQVHCENSTILETAQNRDAATADH